MRWKTQISVAAVALILGIMLAAQYRTTEFIETRLNPFPTTRLQEALIRLKDVSDENSNLRKEVTDLRDKLNESANKAGADKALRDELEKAQVLAGLVPVRGQGVELVLDDAPKKLQPGQNPNFYIIHEEDLLKVVNELRAGGAEALAINGQRLLATSEIRCAGTTILVNTVRIVPPVHFLATGNPGNLAGSLEIKGGILESLRVLGFKIQLNRRDNILIPAYTAGITMEYSRSAGEGGR